MRQEIWPTVQLIWNDPVWSKVIATGITAILVAVGAYLMGWFPIIRQWLVSESKGPNWLSVIGAVTVAFITWTASHKFHVAPLEEQVANLGGA